MREILPFLAPVRSGFRQRALLFDCAQGDARQTPQLLSKNSENGFGAASRAVLFGRVYLGLDQSDEYYPTGGLQVCDGGYRCL